MIELTDLQTKSNAMMTTKAMAAAIPISDLP
jgi:hypothetical protein